MQKKEIAVYEDNKGEKIRSFFGGGKGVRLVAGRAVGTREDGAEGDSREA